MVMMARRSSLTCTFVILRLFFEEVILNLIQDLLNLCRRTIMIFKLQGVELVIFSLHFKKLIMRPFFDNPAVDQYYNPVRIPYGGQPVGDDQGGPVLHELVKCILYL
jgi:hypothetical protein